MWGVLNSAGAAICLATSRCTQEWNVAQAINAVTGTRLWLLFVFSSWNGFDFVVAFSSYAAAVSVIRLLLCSGSYTSPLTQR